MIKFPLPGVSLFHAFFDKAQHLVVAEFYPGFGDQIAWWHLAGEALDDDVGVEPFDEVDDKFDVFFQIKEMKDFWVLLVFFSHFGAFENLQLMEFDGGQR